jgi:hypothetical protein
LARLPDPANIDALVDRLPAPPLRIRFPDGDALDVGADDPALRVDLERGPVLDELLWRTRLLLAQDQVRAHRLVELPHRSAHVFLSSLDLRL